MRDTTTPRREAGCRDTLLEQAGVGKHPPTSSLTMGPTQRRTPGMGQATDHCMDMVEGPQQAEGLADQRPIRDDHGLVLHGPAVVVRQDPRHRDEQETGSTTGQRANYDVGKEPRGRTPRWT